LDCCDELDDDELSLSHPVAPMATTAMIETAAGRDGM
jgi:hypothetical protein